MSLAAQGWGSNAIYVMSNNYCSKNKMTNNNILAAQGCSSNYNVMSIMSAVTVGMAHQALIVVTML